MKLTYRLLLLATLTLAATPGACLFAQGKSSTSIGDSLFNMMDWKGSSTAYQEQVKHDPDNSGAWFRLGFAQHAMGRYREAIIAYHKSRDLFGSPVTTYNIACAHARLAEREKALSWLETAVKEGFAQSTLMEGDSDLVSLHGDARFNKALNVSKANANPCKYVDEYRQFDFWIGEWDVVDPQGNPAGSNTVARWVGDCAIEENWTGGKGGRGKSINYYDAASKKWRQTWIDQGGRITQYVGGLKSAGVMYLEADATAAGVPVKYRMTFTKKSDDRVHQLWEQSSDGGASWSVVFDGMYVRKKA